MNDRRSDNGANNRQAVPGAPAAHALSSFGDWVRRLPSERLAGGLVVALILLPLVAGRYAFIMRLINFVLIYCLLAMGLNIITGCTGLFNMGHAAFYGIGAYASALLMMRLNQPFVVCFAFAVLVTGFAGFLISFLCLKVHSDFLGLITTAFGTVFNTIALHWMSLTNGPLGIPGIPPPSVAGFVFDTPSRYYYLFLAIVVLTYVALHNILDSRVGRALYSIRDDEICAAAQGINVNYFKTLAFILGTLPAGMAGSLAAHYLRFVSPEPFRFVQSTKVLTMIILGGLGSLPGSILGAIFFVALPEIFRPLAVYEVGIGGLVTLVLMLFRPQGILGSIAYAGEGGLEGALYRWRQRIQQQRRQRMQRGQGAPLD